MRLIAPRLSLTGLLLIALPLFAGTTVAVAAAPTVATKQSVADVLANQPIAFEANQGQFDRRFDYVSRGAGYQFLVHPTGAVMSLSAGDASANVAMTFAGSNPDAQADSHGLAPMKVNYLLGRDPKNWHTAVPTYGSVRYRSLYPGIDVIYYGKQRQLEYDLIVSAGADPNQLRIAFDGADSLAVTPDGDLVLKANGREVEHRHPVAYQNIDNKRVDVPVSYRIGGNNEVVFELGQYDCNRELVIDPLLVFSTALGGLGADTLHAIAVDPSGNIIVVGKTVGSAWFGTSGSYAPNGHLNRGFVDYNISDGFVTKLSPTGSSIVFTTFIGGQANDDVWGVAVDPTGRIIIGGETASSDFPVTTGALITSLPLGFSDYNGRTPHGFVSRLNSDGSGFVYSTYLGGNSVIRPDRVIAVATDSTGAAYATGDTESRDFPISSGAYQPTMPEPHLAFGRHDAFATKLSASGALVYSTYLGGPDYDRADAIAVDSGGNAYVRVKSNGNATYPTTAGAYQTTGDCFVSKLNPTGSALVYSTGLGGSCGALLTQPPSPGGLAIDASGSVYVAGQGTVSTAGAYAPAGCGNSSVTKLTTDGTSAVYSTYFGPRAPCTGWWNTVYALAVDGSGNAWVGGETTQTDYPIINGIQPPAGTAHSNGFLTEINAAGTDLLFSTAYGGADGGETVTALALSGSAVVLGGIHGSRDLWRKSAVSTTAALEYGQMFVAKIDPTVPDPNGSQYIQSVSPLLLDPEDARLYIRGFGFQNGCTVTLGTLSAVDVYFRNSTGIIADFPSGQWLPPGDYQLKVTNPDTTVLTYPTLIHVAQYPWLYPTGNARTTIEPYSGPTAGGTGVTIHGFNFQPGAKVSFYDQAAQNVAFIDAFTLQAATPPGRSGSTVVSVVNPDGGYGTSRVGRGDFEYVAPAPEVTGVSPNVISSQYTQRFVVTGNNLTGADAGITPGGTTFIGSTERVIDNNTVQCRLGPYPAAEYSVTAEHKDSSNPIMATPLMGALSVVGTRAIDPWYGPKGGGGTVTVKGDGLHPGAEVWFGFDKKSPTVTYVDSTSVRAVVPPKSTYSNNYFDPSDRPVIIIDSDDIPRFAEDYVYYDEALDGSLTVTNISPATGYTTGSDILTITGTGFMANPAWIKVLFDGIQGSNYYVSSATTLSVRTPPHVPGTVDVVVIDVNTGAAAIIPNGYTYARPAPTVQSVVPNKGLPGGGTAVSIKGRNFGLGAVVTIGGIVITNPMVVNSTTITATTLPHALGGVDVVVTNPDLQTHTLTNGFTYAYPTVTITPPSSTIGPNGTGTLTAAIDFPLSSDTIVTLSSSDTSLVTVPANVTITAGSTSATFAATATANAGTATITATLPAPIGGGTGTATVNVTGAPNIVSFTPTSGTGGTAVTVTGTRFTGTNAMTFGGVSVTSFTVDSDTQITVTAPASGVTGPICATTPGPMTGCSSTNFTFAPRITNFSPSSGGAGTSVTITGVNFEGATSVTFGGGAAATPFTVSPNGTSITTTVPAAATTGPITVTTPAGSGTSASAFGVPPVITSFTPLRGNAGTVVTITGVRFTGATSVKFNNVAASAFTVVNDTTITATAPGSVTTGPITVTTPFGTANSPDVFTVAAVPAVTSFTPNKGTAGTSVTITGTNFGTATVVRFNGVDASFSVSSSTTIVATVPGGATNGPIAVSNEIGTGTSSALFFFPPVLTTFVPNAAAAGSTVSISGNNFMGATGVTFNGAVSTFTVVAQNSITTTVPAGATTGKLTITTPYGPVTSTYDFVVYAADTPTVTATATSATSVLLTWNGIAGHNYGIERISVKTEFFSANRIATVTGSSWVDTTVQANRTYIYHVVDVGTGIAGNNDYATTVMFTDDALTAGTAIKAVHVTQLRTAVNAMRTAAALATVNWTNPDVTGQAIRLVHINELRTGLREALVSLSRYINYTDSTLDTSTPVRAVHFNELRVGVK